MYGTHVSESLRKQFHNGFDAPESPDSAAFPVANLVVMLQIVFLLMLGKEIAEAFGCHVYAKKAIEIILESYKTQLPKEMTEAFGRN